MTESDNGWVWAALAGLVDLTTQHDEAVTEAERLEGCVRDEMERIQGATGLSRERLGEMVEGMRVIGSPVLTSATATDTPASAPPTAPASSDPLAIPTYLRRGEESSQEGAAETGSQAETART